MPRFSFIKDLIARISIHSLGMKLVVAIGGLICVGSFAFWYMIIHSMEDEVLKNTVLHADTYIHLVEKSSFDNMLINNTNAIQEIFESMTTEHGITNIRVFDLNGKIFFASSKDEVGRTVPKDSPTCLICHMKSPGATGPLKVNLGSLNTPQWVLLREGERRILKSTIPIFNDRPCYTSPCHHHKADQKVLGILETDYSMKDIDEKIWQQKVATAIFGLIFTAFTSLILTIILWKLVIKPLITLSDGMESVTKGNLDKTVSISTKDEIGTLATIFNEMTREIRSSREKLENWAKELEEEVTKKTEEIKRGQEQFVHTEKLASLGRMAAGVAHEINSPLTGIVTFAHLMLKRIPPENKMDREDLDVIIEQAERCSKIIKGLLGFSRAIPSEKNEMNIHDAIQNAINIIQHQAKFHNIKIEVNEDGNLPPIKGDSSQVQQVFLNLLINAADAMNDKGQITISTSRTVVDGIPYVEIAVSDTGPGISEEHISRLFEPFFTTKPVGKGTGLGLAVSHGIIKKHGGHIIVKSTPGAGATFLVRLPIMDSKNLNVYDGHP